MISTEINLRAKVTSVLRLKIPDAKGTGWAQADVVRSLLPEIAVGGDDGTGLTDHGAASLTRRLSPCDRRTSARSMRLIGRRTEVNDRTTFRTTFQANEKKRPYDNAVMNIK